MTRKRSVFIRYCHTGGLVEAPLPVERTAWVLSDPADSVRASEVALALDAERVALDGWPAFYRAHFREARPLVLVWSRAAQANAEFRRIIDFLVANGSGAAGELYVFQLDGSSLDPLLINELRRAFAAAPTRASSYGFVERREVEQSFARTLQSERCLLLLAPERAGARTLSAAVAARLGFDESTTWLSPPPIEGTSQEDFFSRLVPGRRDITSPLAFFDWVKRSVVGAHLLVVQFRSKVDRERLTELAAILHSAFEESRSIHVLTAGNAACARLRFERLAGSLFTGIPVERVPAFSVDEVQLVLERIGLPGRQRAEGVQRATGGHPGFLRLMIEDGKSLDPQAITERLARHQVVRDRIRLRIREDDEKGREPGLFHMGAGSL